MQETREEKNARNRARYKERMKDPAYVEQRRAQGRKQNAARKDDPSYVVKRRAQQNAAYHRKTPEEKREQFRRNSLKSKYGITPGQYEEMLVSQGGVCAICGSHPIAEQLLSVDHCHTTGKVRGLLCQSCNIGIGHFEDSPSILEKAISYLKGAE